MKDKTGRSRLFISAEIEPHIKDILLSCQDTMRLSCGEYGFRYIPEENMHLTLHFLGETPEHRIRDICELIEESCSHFTQGSYAVTHSGSFNKKGDPRVVWAGIHDTDRTITGVYRSLQRTLLAYGIQTERRKYVPHLTIAYVTKPPSALLLQLIPQLIRTETNGRLATISLKKSVLKNDGAVHTSLFEYTLQ